MAYSDTLALKRYLGIPLEEVNDDDLLEFFLAVAQNSIDRFCQQSFEAAADSTRYFSPLSFEAGGAVYGRELILDAPLLSVTTLTNGDNVVVAAGDYALLPLNGTPKYTLRLKQSSGLFWTYDDDVESDQIAITGKWAYSLTADETIQQVTLRMAAYLYRQKDNASDLDRAVAIGGGGMILPAKLPDDIQTLLVKGGYVRTGAG